MGRLAGKYSGESLLYVRQPTERYAPVGRAAYRTCGIFRTG